MLGTEGFISTQPARICAPSPGGWRGAAQRGWEGCSRHPSAIPAGFASPGDTSRPHVPPARYLMARGAGLIPAGLQPQHVPMGTGRLCGHRWGPQAPELPWGLEMDPGSAVLLSVRPASGLLPSGSRCAPVAWAGAQPAAPELEAASPFSIPAAQGGGRRGQAHPHPQSIHLVLEGLDVAQLGWEAAAAAAPLGQGLVGAGGPQHPLGLSPRPPSPLLTAPGGPWRDQPFSGRCRGTGRVLRPPAAGPGGSAAAPPGQPHVLRPAASVGTQGSTGVSQTLWGWGQGLGAVP